MPPKKKKKSIIKKVNKPFKEIFTYTLDDLVFDPNDQEEIDYVTPYVGTYIIRRMGAGPLREVQASFIQIETSLKSDKKGIEIEDIVPDLSSWQDKIVLHSLYDSPFDKRPYGGWGSRITELEKFLYEMPPVINDILLESAMILNNFTEDERKN